MKPIPTSSEARKLTLAQIQALPMDVRIALAQREASGAIVWFAMSALCSVGAALCAFALCR